MNNEEHKPYLINEGDIVTVIREDNGANTFYKIAVTVPVINKKSTLKEKRTKKIINIPKGTELQNGDKIKILKMHENFYFKSFETIFILNIDEFELIESAIDKQETFENEEMNFDEAIAEFNETIEGDFE